MKREFPEFAVVQIIETILLLTLAIVVISIVYLAVFSELDPDEKTFVTIAGKVKSTNLILEHQGGETLGLNSPVSFIIAGEKFDVLVGDLLIDENYDNRWSLGERMVFPFEYNVYNLRNYLDIDITAVNRDGNEIVLKGPVELHPVSDIGIEMSVDNLYPQVGDIVTFTIDVTCYGGDVNGSVDVKIKYIIPDELEFVDSTAQVGSYNNSSGIWYIDLLLENQPISLNIRAKVVSFGLVGYTQFVLILDGSESTNPDKWNLMKEGIKKAINNGVIFPHNGMVELTVIEYGDDSPPRGNAELLPTIITEANYHNVAQDLRNTQYPRGYAPMGCGIRLCADLVHDDGNFSEDTIQKIILITDGKPDCFWISGAYNGVHANYLYGKSSAEDAREYLINKLELNEDNYDEFDVIAVGSDPDIDWIKNYIVWPQPGYLAPPYNQGPGFVIHVQSWSDFEDAIEEIFGLLFTGINNRVYLYDAFTLDITPYNNNDVIVLEPLE